MDAVATGAATDRNDQIARLRLFERFVAGEQADVAAIDQRVAQVALVEIDGAVHGGDAHAVAVIAHALDDAPHHAPRMEDSRRQRVGGHIGRREAEHIRVADRLCAEPRPHDVADHAADARIRAAIGLERRGMIVRFDLEGEVELVVEPHDASIVLEHAHAPVAAARGSPILAQLLRRREDRLLEHVLELPLAPFVAIRNPPSERLVAAMFAPRLSDRLQLDVCRIAVQLAEVRADRLHLGRLQVELPLAAEPHQGIVIQFADRHVLEREWSRLADAQFGHRQRPEHHVLDRVVGQQPLADALDDRIARPGEPILADRRNRFERHAQIGGGRQGALGNRVHHAGLQQHRNAVCCRDQSLGIL